MAAPVERLGRRVDGELSSGEAMAYGGARPVVSRELRTPRAPRGTHNRSRPASSHLGAAPSCTRSIPTTGSFSAGPVDL